MKKQIIRGLLLIALYSYFNVIYVRSTKVVVIGMLAKLPDLIVAKLYRHLSSLALKILARFYRHPPSFIAHILEKLSVARFRSKLLENMPISEYVDFSFSFNVAPFFPIYIAPFFPISALSIKPFQNKEEMINFLKFIKNFNPEIALEIGSALGGTLFLFSRVVDKKGILISIDLPGDQRGGGNPEWKIPLFKSFARGKQNIHLVRSDSHDFKTFETIRKILNDKEVDLLFIDGDHTYSGAKKDFEMYSPLVKKGGVIAFHDILPLPPEWGIEVNRFWDEIKESFKYMEIVREKNQDMTGIGILFV